MKYNLSSTHLAKSSYPLLLATCLLASIFLTLRPVQAAPAHHPLQADVVVTTTIQAAIDAATPGDTVIIPAGIYTESLTLSKAVSLTGVSSATTIIHALPNQRVLTITSAAIDHAVVISGLTITGGRANNGPFCFGACGGGILISGNAQPLLQSLIISNNSASRDGGGILFATGVENNIPLTLTNVILISNTATRGGGMDALGILTLINTQFISNTAAIGGGTFFRDATIIDSRFERNIAGFGGGLVASTTMTATHTDFIGNIAATNGAGAFVDVAATILGGHFEGNSAGGSGGGLLVGGPLILTDTQFIHNTATSGGGISYIHLLGSPTPNGRIVNALFANNSVTNTGAALYLESPGTVGILHTTIADTSLNSKEAIVSIDRSIGLTNTIITSHTVGISQTAGTVSEDYNLFFNVPTINTGVVAHGGNSLTGDPRFVDPTSDNYHLQAGSDALNAALPGLVDTDFEGDPRPLGLGPDIGFDEAPFSSFLKMTKTVNPAGPLTPGQALTYTIVILNNDLTAATGVQLTDTLPAFVTGSNLATTTNIPAGQAVTFTLPAAVAADAPAGPVITNTAHYSHTSGSGQASAAFTVVAPSLMITKTVTPATPLTAGQVLTYTIVVANNGHAPANGVLITDTLPTSITGTSLSTITNLAAGQSVTFTLPAAVAADAPAGTVITNTASYSHTSGSGQASAAFIVQGSAEPSAGIYLPLIRKD